MLRRLSLLHHGGHGGGASGAGSEDGDHVQLVESVSGEGEGEGGVAGVRDLMSDSEIENVKVRRNERLEKMIWF